MRPTISLNTPTPPPAWALLERELLRYEAQACRTFFERYFDERGYLQCVARWGGNDGPDDAIENLTDWPTLHFLGGPDYLLDLYKLGWEGHLKQYTEAKTTEVPFARDGMYYKEFPVMFDWVHNGEGLAVFNLQGMSDPGDRLFQQRTRRFAGFYLNEDPQAPNYDPRHKIIRSMFNGSRGPLLRKATALDWAGDPIEVEGRFAARHGERTYEEMLAHFRDYNDIVGDHPQNLVATGLGFNAFALTGEQKYRDWVLEYVDAWRERTLANGNIIPTNIGLDGTPGGECGGKWYGGCYGWSFTVEVPQTREMANRNTHYLGLAGFANALLLTGDQRYTDVWRQLIDTINAARKTIDGQVMYPRMYGDQGWYAYTPQPYNHGALDVYYWSMDRADLSRLGGNGWIEFLEGKNPSYPVQALQQDFERVRQRMEQVHNDPTTPDTRLSDDPLPYNPAITGSLVQLMLGGLPTRFAQPVHCRLRYFDPVRRRAGLPEDVAALVEELGPDHTVVSLVNLNPVEARTVVVQGGAYGEHQLTGAECEGQDFTLDAAAATFMLSPGAGSRIKLRMQRYANPPDFAFPWDRTKRC
ncbi:MAG: hypothetical protein IT369_04930 [Candidatus Latescibacteria bacterium]|nr:hypothetical protein [Candidatus Latescibacterota bacterium]